MKGWIRAAACAGLTVLVVGAGAAGDKQAQPTAWERFKSYAHTEKNAAIAEGRKAIAAIDRQIAEMKQQARAAKQETVAAHKANMAELQAKRKAAQAELDKLGRSTANAWEATREGFSQAFRDLQQAYDRAKSEAGS